ncbi:hypothetical protein [Pendulispora albinea]|uniref:Uncharacterized protein n=1 Tax=Pendulispora albinea TaxID=2741071 RepID=A0ABZ2LU54_9BACT
MMVHSFTPGATVSMEKSVYWQLTIDREHRLVRLVRTPEPYAQLVDIGASFLFVDRQLVDVDRKQYRLLVDLREGPRRNDSAFEAEMERFRRALVVSFRRTALVVKSATGLLQVKRHMQQDGALQAGVFMGETQAIQFLQKVTLLAQKGP